VEERTSFEDIWTSFKASNYSGSFSYADPNVPFRKSVHAHFVPGQPPVRYGVYVVRVVSSGTVIYIGKGGTVTSQGNFKDQDIPGRLTAERGKLSSDA
jgi:hypothetical protein